MSDADLATRLRCIPTSLSHEAADRIEALAAEVERLGKCYDLAINSRLEWRRQSESAERALVEAVEIMRRIDADFSGPRVTVHDGNAFSHFQELNRQSVAIRTAARDFITAQEKEKGK